ncbi:hypothetical protein A9Q75_03280 [Colwellia psychrerythraea]|uniref:Uncharacterized protein n=1 Tax=Colwellia psychrerythraea TaxID=28229 RepID=A0A1Y5EU49_COLPS|nr:hypothetical protein A9Q75_03280 [Colwellia psychrerythraea]
MANFIGLAFNTYVAGIFLISAIALAFNAWQYKKQDMSLWFKPFIFNGFGTDNFYSPSHYSWCIRFVNCYLFFV